MTLDELFAQAKVSGSQKVPMWLATWCDDYDIFRSLGIEGMDIRSVSKSPIETQDLVTWICTDTNVGLEAIYFEGEPVAVFFKKYRKADGELRWKDQESAEKVRQYLMSLREDHQKIQFADEEFIDKSLRWVDVNIYDEPGFRNYLK